MIVHIPFSENVRVRSLFLKLGMQHSVMALDSPCNNTISQGRGEVAPRQLRIYANHPNIIDFSEAEESKPLLNISLLEGEATVIEYPLRVAAFSSINSLSLFFVSDALSIMFDIVDVRLSRLSGRFSGRKRLQDILHWIQGGTPNLTKVGDEQACDTSCNWG